MRATLARWVVLGALGTAGVVVPKMAGAQTTDGPRGGDRVGAGVGVLLAGLGTAGAATWLAADVPGGAGPGVAMGAASLVGVVVGIVEIVRGAGEWRRPSPVALGPGGFLVRF